jgi:hypothetical protein
MAKNPNDRFPSAVSFARALQKVQIELSHSVTPIDIVDEHPAQDELEDDGDGLTRVREIVSIDPDAASFTRPSAATQPRGPQWAPTDIPRFDAPAAAEPPVEATQIRPPRPAAPSPDVDERTILRAPMVVAPDAAAAPLPAPSAPEVPTPPPPASATPAAPRSRRGLWITLIAAAGVVVIVGGIFGLNALVAGIAPEPNPQASEETVDPQDPISEAVPKVADLVATRDGDQVTFTWTNPSPLEGDSYLWTNLDPAGDAAVNQVTEEQATVTGAGQVCIEVMLRRENGTASDVVKGCG